MKRIMRWLVPKERKFFELLAEQSQNALNMANELKEFIDNYPKLERSERKARVQSINKLKQGAEDPTKNVMHMLYKDRSAAIGRESIEKIAMLLEEVQNFMNAAASRFVVLSIERVDDYTIKLANLLHAMLDELHKSVLKLKKLKDAREHCAKIYEIGGRAGRIFDDALSDLFHFYKNPVDIMKYKEVYEILENAINKCRDAARAIERLS